MKKFSLQKTVNAVGEFVIIVLMVTGLTGCAGEPASQQSLKVTGESINEVIENDTDNSSTIVNETDDINNSVIASDIVDVMAEQIVPKETESMLFTGLPEGKTSSAIRHYIDQYDYYERASDNDFAWSPIDLSPLCERTGDERYRNFYCYNGCLIIDKETEFGGVTHPEYEHLSCKGIVYIDEIGVMPRYISVGNVSSPYSGGELLLDDGFVDDDMVSEIMSYLREVS